MTWIWSIPFCELQYRVKGIVITKRYNFSHFALYIRKHCGIFLVKVAKNILKWKFQKFFDNLCLKFDSPYFRNKNEYSSLSNSQSFRRVQKVKNCTFFHCTPPYIQGHKLEFENGSNSSYSEFIYTIFTQVVYKGIEFITYKFNNIRLGIGQ